MASSFSRWLVDPKKNPLAAIHMKTLSSRLRNYGLRYDDLYDPMYDLDVKEALNRLPREIVDARNQRLLRAMDLSMKHQYLPEDLQGSRLQNTLTPCISRPFYQYVQHLGLSSSRTLLADSSGDATPISSPLTPMLTSSTGSIETEKAISKPSKVQAVLKGIKQSPKKVNLVAALVRGMRVEDALLQLQVTVKRAAKTVYQVIHSARANAVHNHGFDPDRLLVAEAFLGKGLFKKRLSYHAKGKCGLMVRPECRLTVVLREITPKEEAEIAKLRVSNFKKLTKREKRLVPHKLIETTPIWDRKSRARSRGVVV